MLTGSFAFAQGPEVVIPRPSEVTLSEGVYTYEQEPSVKVSYVKGKFGPEEYQISITKRGVKVKVSSVAGEFYALQTLAQMTQQGNVKQLQCCEIKDAPRFPYRGLHVDVSRHFRSLDFLKKQIDAMAMFKMNRIHLHLTDAAGWRMQIDSYPRLTSFAAWRPQHTWKEWWAAERLYAEEGQDGVYGGYYTKEQMR
jgi:hexosaminidase